MKWLFQIFFLIIPFTLISQTDQNFKSGIGLHLTHDGPNGIGSSIRYSRQIFDRGIMKLEFKFNGNGRYTGRIGYEFMQLKYDKLELGIGLDFRYRYIDGARFGLGNYEDLSVELPLELRYHFSSNYFLSGGYTFSRRLTKNNSLYNPGSTDREVRIGLGYRF